MNYVLKSHIKATRLILCQTGLTKFTKETQGEIFEKQYSGRSVKLTKFELLWNKILNQQ